jgi:hypothetical protein
VSSHSRTSNGPRFRADGPSTPPPSPHRTAEALRVPDAKTHREGASWHSYPLTPPGPPSPCFIGSLDVRQVAGDSDYALVGSAPPAPGRGRLGGWGGVGGGCCSATRMAACTTSRAPGVLRVAWPVESAGPIPTTALGSLPPKIWVCSPAGSRPAPPRAPRRLAVVWIDQPTCSPQSKRRFAPQLQHVRNN